MGKKKQTMTIDQLETTKSDMECPSVGQNHIAAAQGVSRFSYVGYRWVGDSYGYRQGNFTRSDVLELELKLSRKFFFTNLYDSKRLYSI